MTAHPDHATHPGAAAVLDAAARTSLFATSVFNTQPWRWRITGDSTQLNADPRQLLREVPAGVGEPNLVVRLGYVESPDALPLAPRRDAAEVITVQE